MVFSNLVVIDELRFIKEKQAKTIQVVIETKVFVMEDMIGQHILSYMI